MRGVPRYVLGALLSFLVAANLHAQTPVAGSQTVKLSLKFTAPRAGLDEVTFGMTALNRSFQSVCSFKAMSIDLDAANARNALRTMKKGDRIGAVQLHTDGETFPYHYALADAVLSNVLERQNGTARLTFEYGRCDQVRR